MAYGAKDVGGFSILKPLSLIDGEITKKGN
jgi:hypothetical protein